MEDQEFDQTLRGLAGGSRLPYDAGQWEQMARRLDAFEAGRASAPRRTIPVYQWATAAAAACLVVLAGLHISKEPGNRMALESNPARPGIVAEQQAPEPRMADSMPAGGERAFSSDRQVIAPVVKKSAPVKRGPASGQVIVAGASEFPKPAAAQHAPEAIPEKPQPGPEPAQPAAAERKPQLAAIPAIIHDYPLQDGPAKRNAERRTAFGVHGGYNIGQAKNNFTLGVSVKRKLSERLHLETGLAFVSGAYKTYEPVVTTIITNGGGGSLGEPQSVQTIETFEASSNHLLYLQAAPTLNYRIYKGLTAGGGVDAQRLLGGRNTDVVFLNSMGEQAPAQPQWDFGVTARMDVQVARKLRAGMMYRESMRGISKSTQEAARRNYLLLQLSYTLF